jgi:hypothetical protein
MRKGDLLDLEIAADASWLRHIERVREGGKRYRPASRSDRPSVNEQSIGAGKPRRKAEQLKLDLRAAHLSCLRKGMTLGKRRQETDVAPRL